jgi:hypothetical protein
MKNVVIAAVTGLIVGAISTNWAHNGLAQAQAEQSAQPQITLGEESVTPTGIAQRCCACPEEPLPQPMNCSGALRDAGCP